jgi:hypothetical protein
MVATAVFLPRVAAPAAWHLRHRSPQPKHQRGFLSPRAFRFPRRLQLAVSAVQEKKKGEAKTAEEITQKYGLEFGLWKVSSRDTERLILTRQAALVI